MRTLVIAALFIVAVARGEEPFPKSDAILALVKKELKGQRDYSRRYVRRFKDKQAIELEIFMSGDGNVDIARKIFGNFARYPDWTLTDINKNSQGKEYLIQLTGLKYDQPKSTMALSYEFKFPLFKTGGSRTYDIRLCPEEKYLCVEVDAVPITDSYIIKSTGRMYIFPGTEGQMLVYFRGHIIFGPWLLYEAMPEQVVLKESSDRIQTLLQNYQREETKVYQEGQAGKVTQALQSATKQ